MARFMDGWVLPTLDDTNREFFTSGRIILQACAGCQTVQHPPEDVCHACGGTEFQGCEASGSGTLYSYTVVRHPLHPILAERVPYTIAVVSLADRPEVRVTGNLIDSAPEDVRVGLPVRAVWEEIPDPEGGETIRLLQWTPV